MTTTIGPLASERLAEIRAALDAVPAPPWRWIGLRNAGGPQLVTDHSGRQYLLRAAKPTDRNGDELLDPVDDGAVYGDIEFRDQREGEKYSTMRTGSELGIGRTSYDPDSIVGVDNPVAQWVECSPQFAAELLAEVDRLHALVETGRKVGDSDARELARQAQAIERLLDETARLRGVIDTARKAAGMPATTEGCAR